MDAETDIATREAHLEDVLRQARLWLAGQPHRTAIRYSGLFSLMEAIDSALGDSLPE